MTDRSGCEVAGLPPGLWPQGWWVHARRAESVNRGPRPPGSAGVVDMVVLHSISLPPGQYGGPQVEAFFTNRLNCEEHPYFDALRGVEVSAHFLIRRDGQTIQFVSCDDRAWHAGQSTWRGRAHCNDHSVGIELEGLEGDRFEDAQYRTLERLLVDLCRRWPIRDVVGHEHIAPGRKSDPGAGFEWTRVLEMMRGLSLRGPFETD